MTPRPRSDANNLEATSPPSLPLSVRPSTSGCPLQHRQWLYGRVYLHRTSMHENRRISLRENTKRSEDMARRFLWGRKAEIRSFWGRAIQERLGRCAERGSAIQAWCNKRV